MVLATSLCVQAMQAQTSYASNEKKKGIFGLFSQTNNQNQPNEKQTLFNVLKDLNKQKGVYFLFSDPSLGAKPVNAITDANAEIEKILEQVLKNTGLKYKKVSENAFVILLSKENPKKITQPGPVNFQDGQGFNVDEKTGDQSVNDVISGRVTNTEGVPVIGVSVTVKG
ncbi:MAG: secretin and TonB N-terminal domain-containing protein, partial [Chitinophagaceae bacterium]